jgi:hypothetical protein
MRIIFVPLAIVSIFYYLAAADQGQNTEKSTGDSLSDIGKKKNNIHVVKNYPNPF